jgi:hypothetical protein
LGEIIKKLISVFGKARQRATQATPLLTAPESSGFYTSRKRQIEPRSAESTRQIETRRKGKGGKILFFFNNLKRNNILTRYFYTKMCIPFFLFVALTNCAYLLSACLASKNASYIVKAESIKGRMS